MLYFPLIPHLAHRTLDSPIPSSLPVYPMLSCPILSYPYLSYHTLANPYLSYPTLPYLNSSDLISSDLTSSHLLEPNVYILFHTTISFKKSNKGHPLGSKIMISRINLGIQIGFLSTLKIYPVGNLCEHFTC